MRTLFSILFLFFTASLIAQPQQKKNGKVVVKNAAGVVTEEGRVKKHQKTGPWIRRYDSGDTMEVANYQLDSLDGPYRSYFQKGGVQVSGSYTMGVRTGAWMRYSRSHKIVQLSTYDANGKETGLQQTFDDSGKLRKERMVAAGGYEYVREYTTGEVLVKRYTLLNGKREGNVYKYERVPGPKADTLPLAITGYHNDLKEGAEKEWAMAEGRRVLIREGWYKNGKRDSTFRTYNRQGQLTEERHFVDDRQNGMQRTFDSKGHLHSEHSYNMGKKEGVSKVYTGTALTLIEWYSLDAMDSSMRYSGEGKLLARMTRVDAQTKQFWEYHPNGKLSKTWTEKSNRKEGLLTSYYPDGKKKNEITYKNGRAEGQWRAWNEKGVLVIVAKAEYGQDTEEQVYTNKGIALKEHRLHEPAPVDTAYDGQVRRYMPPEIRRMPQLVADEVTEEEEVSPDALVVDRAVDEQPQVFAYAEVMPSFPGGDDAFMAYLKNNIRYPVMEKESGKQGAVYIRFTVQRDGSITDITPLKEVPGAPGLTKEAIRVMKGMPDWIPGKMNGRNVAVYVTQPVRFKLD